MAEPDTAIAVDPPVVLAAARAELSAAGQLRAAAPIGLDVAAAGEPACVEALGAATAALAVVAQVCAGGLEDLGLALQKAYYVYRAADRAVDRGLVPG